MTSHAPLEKTIACLARLPGIGRRSAERIAVRLVGDRELLAELRATLDETAREARACSRCGALTTAKEDPCRLCMDPRRDDSILCVVEEPGDVRIVDRSGAFRGRYHVLGGKLSPMQGQGPGGLRAAALLRRVDKEKFREVVLALSTDVEGDATAGFIAEQLGRRKVNVTRLAFGLPAGSGVMYSDPVTLARALEGRRRV